MRAVCLLGVLTVAHLLMLVGHSVPLSLWAPPAYLWQDLLVALLFGSVDYVVRRPRLGWAIYAILVIYIAINVPIARILSSPLTWTMMRAARGPLRDSIHHYVSVQNIGAILLVLVTGALLPLVLEFRGQTTRIKGTPKFRTALILAAIVITAIGPIAARQIETSGYHRNAFGVLWPLRAGRIDTSAGSSFRTSAFSSRVAGDSLNRYRGAAAGRNVVLIALESTAAQYLSLYGARQDPTPNLTQLAAQSIVFERAYTVYPESIKGLFSVLCSRYPAFGSPGDADERVPCPSLAQALKDAGYHTALFHSGRFMYLGMEDLVKDRGFQTLEDAGAIGGNVNSSFGVDEPATIERIFQWMDALPKGKPFFITYLPVAGHHPYAVPERGPFGQDSDFGNYLNALHYGDKSLGDLLRGLRERNLYSNTLFVFYGDHGEAFGQHDGNFGHSLFIYDENVRVPYMISAPGLIQEPVRATQTASLIDTAPTILDLLGLAIPREVQGDSLLEGHRNMALFFTDYSLGFLGLYDECWKFIFEINNNRSKLYDVCHDPGEAIDASTHESTRTQAYQQNLQRWISSKEP